MSGVARPPSLTLPSRLEIRRKLGEGAFGNVYEVWDREQRSGVALKSLERLDAHSLFRFKREFRELADIIHPNLVRLHELFCFEERWCFTMDLIRGVSFIDYVRPGYSYPQDAPTVETGLEEGEPVVSGQLPGQVDEGRLRGALSQLVEGVGALHRAGKLHRDLKPQNVLVCDDGRVLVLDFGLLDDIGPGGGVGDGHREIVGTPAYMAPESAAGYGDGVESDWYSVGVMLYEALTGQLPYEGKPISMLLRKQTVDPVDPAPLVSSTLGDLAQLSVALLSRNPEDRPGFEAIRAALQTEASRLVVGAYESGTNRREQESVSLFARQPTEFLVGREIQLEIMTATFRRVARGRGVMLRVYGVSGMGKTALVRFFVDDLRRSKQAVALFGRCFECESVPYKALDSLVDALTQRLMAMRSEDVADILPRDLVPVTRLFPVLRRVPLIAAADTEVELEGADPQEVRQAAFEALRSLLRGLAERKPLVLWIDDLQWGDEDSAAFLVDLLQPPGAPGVLLILSHRSEDSETSPILRVLIDSLPNAQFEHRELEVGPLAPADCERLASLLAREEGGRESQPPGVAGESGGSPLFLLQLVKHVSRGASTHGDVRLDDVLSDHIATLSEPAQQLLRVVSLAGRSIEIAVARQAAGLVEELREALDSLRMQRLVRTQGLRGADLVEPYHDRIREVVTARLDERVRAQLHGSLAAALESMGRADPEALAVHYRGAGDRAMAWKYVVLAGDRAASALAFRRAAELYGEALALDPERDTQAIRIKMADALADAGHGAEASAAYLEALPAAVPADALELRRKAAEQSLRVGRVDEGLSLLQDLLAAAGMKLAQTPARALLFLLLRRAWLRIRGFGYRGTYETDREALRRIDMGWALAVGLSNSDAIRGADIQTKTLLLALRTGEPSRIARGLALEAGMLATSGPKNRKRAARLLEASTALAATLGDPYALGWAHCGAGAVAYFEGRFQDCIDQVESALKYFACCPGVSWERTTMRHYAIWSLIWLGQVAEASRRVRAQLKAAFERGDLYSATDLRLFTSNMAWLVDDDVQGARRVVEEAMALWSKRGFHAQHFYALYAHGQIDLYVGDGVTWLSRIAEAWDAFRASMLLQVQSVRLETLHLRARCALCAASQDPSKRDVYLGVARADARRLARENSLFAPALADLVRASLCLFEGSRERSIGHLRSALGGFEKAGMMQYAAAAARRLGAMDGEGGKALAAEAVTRMQGEGIRDIERWTNMLAPGPWVES
jgi:hypothetical protein